jgi:succinoglycan biosynthesis protein ExoV
LRQSTDRSNAWSNIGGRVVPWKQIKAYKCINEYKWNDWRSSLDIEFEFCSLPPTHIGDQGAPLKNKIKNNVKRAAKKFGYFSQKWTPVLPNKSSRRHIEYAAECMSTYVDSPNYFMSKETLRNNRIDLLLEDINKYFKLISL